MFAYQTKSGHSTHCQAQNRPISIAILGAGTVASGVYQLIEKNASLIEQKVGATLKLKWILARTPQKALNLGIQTEQITQDFQKILTDPEVDIIIELIGGIEPAKTYIEAALKTKKNVVTANKDLIAKHGVSLFALAETNCVDLMFEASVGGGIPIIMPMRRTLAGNAIKAMMGILNGTTNYMLTQMTKNGLSYAEALKDAQDLGYAEANPSADVDGLDAGRKMAILAKLAFQADITDELVPCEGISKLRQQDFDYAKRFNYVIKMLAVAKATDEGIELGVYPCFIDQKHPLAAVNDAYNALFIKGDAVGEVMLYGQGAGAMPTASSVVGDLMQVMRHICSNATGQGNEFNPVTCEILPPSESRHSFFISMSIADQPKVLAKIAAGFGEHGVSIQSVGQHPSGDGKSELILITHVVKKGAVEATLKALTQTDVVLSIHSIIRVIDHTSSH